MAEYSPMMQHYIATKNEYKIVYCFTDLVIFMKCSLMML